MLEIDAADAGTVIYIGDTETGFGIPSLTIRGTSGKVRLDYADSGIIELDNLIFDCDDVELDYGTKSDFELSDLYRIGTVTLTENVKTISSTGGFSLAEKLDVGDGDFESVSNYAFRDCTIWQAGCFGAHQLCPSDEINRHALCRRRCCQIHDA